VEEALAIIVAVVGAGIARMELRVVQTSLGRADSRTIMRYAAGREQVDSAATHRLAAYLSGGEAA
jgi:hypothetical protein